MKKIVFLVTIITFFCTFSTLAQKTVLQLKVSKDRKDMIASLEKESRIFVKNEYFSLIPSYPKAKNLELQRLYDIVIDDKRVSELTSELQKTGNFEDIQPYEVAHTNNDCNNPYPINDLKIIDGTFTNYAIELINAQCAWDITKGNPDIVVAVADTDFEQTHEDMENQMVHLSGPISAGNHHGILVAGVACAETNNNKGICGVGYNSKAAGYRIDHYIDSDGSVWASSSACIKDAIWAAYLDGRPVINVSWGGTGLNTIAAQEITENGTTLVLAAGNSATSTDHSGIANIPGVINVSGVDANNTHFGTFAPRPGTVAHNQWVDVCALAINVTTCYPGNRYGLGYRGTSFAAPQVAGVVALMRSINNCLSPAEIENMIKATADPIADEHPLYSGQLGAGRVNAYKAVMAAGTREYTNTTISGIKNLSAGYAFNLHNVTIGSNSNVNLTARKEVIIDGTFEVPLGSEFSINIDPAAVTNCD